MVDDNSPKPDEGLIDESRRKEIDRALEHVTLREANILRMYFGLNGKPAMTLEEIGQNLGIVRERVRQIKEMAIRRLKHTSRCRLLKGYL